MLFGMRQYIFWNSIYSYLDIQQYSNIINHLCTVPPYTVLIVFNSIPTTTVQLNYKDYFIFIIYICNIKSRNPRIYSTSNVVHSMVPHRKFTQTRHCFGHMPNCCTRTCECFCNYLETNRTLSFSLDRNLILSHSKFMIIMKSYGVAVRSTFTCKKFQANPVAVLLL